VELRADSGFAILRLYAWCEANQVGCTIGLIPNPVLAAYAAPLLAEAQAQSPAQAGSKVRLAGEAQHQAGSWPLERRVVFKAEALAEGPNTRFVVTTRTEAPLAVYDWYVDRGRQLLSPAADGLLIDPGDLEQQPIGTVPQPLRLHGEVPPPLLLVQSTQQQVHLAVIFPIRVRRIRLAASALTAVHRSAHALPISSPSTLPPDRLARKSLDQKPELVPLRRLSAPSPKYRGRSSSHGQWA
jgi:hypothetical protein